MRIVFSIYIAILFSLCGFSQQGNYFLSNKQYPFINYSENKLIYPADSNIFEPIYQKIDSIMLFGVGKINIVHIGGSHIQADIYTHQIRKRLQSLQYDMDGGRGLIFPFSIAHTNNPSNYRVSYTGEWTYCKATKNPGACMLGLTGMSITTHDKKASIRILPNNDSTTNYTFNSVRLYHAPSKYNMSVESKGEFIQGKYDSIGGFSLFNLSLINELNLRFNCNDSIDETLTIYGISLDNDSPGIVYNAIGVNGARLGTYINCTLYEKHLASIKPDLVIFSIGTNDGNTKHFDALKYHDEYIELIKNTRKAAPNALILITVPNDAYYYKRYVNTNTLLLRKEIYSIAKEYNYGVWDFFNVMGGLNSSQKWYNYGLMRYDRVHFNRPGYILKGDLFVTAFLKGWEKNLALRTESYFPTEKLTEKFLSSQTGTK
jgi:lysophospholipase L1-like esterase